MEETSTGFFLVRGGLKQRPGILPGLFCNVLLIISCYFLRIWNHLRLRKDVNLHHLRRRMDENFHHPHWRDGTHLMMDLKEFSGSFAPGFLHDCDQPAGDSGFELLVWYYLQATRLCSAFAANCCFAVDVGRHFPDDLNILMASQIRLKSYTPSSVFR